MHPITEDSPLFTLTESDFKNTIGEILIFIKAFDDMYSATVVRRTSYCFDEVIYGAKFLPMFSKNTDNTKTILHLEDLNKFEFVSL